MRMRLGPGQKPGRTIHVGESRLCDHNEYAENINCDKSFHIVKKELFLFFVSKLHVEAKPQWIQSFFASFASTALAISAKLLLKHPLTTFVKAKT